VSIQWFIPYKRNTVDELNVKQAQPGGNTPRSKLPIYLLPPRTTPNNHLSQPGGNPPRIIITPSTTLPFLATRSTLILRPLVLHPTSHTTKPIRLPSITHTRALQLRRRIVLPDADRITPTFIVLEQLTVPTVLRADGKGAPFWVCVESHTQVSVGVVGVPFAGPVEVCAQAVGDPGCGAFGSGFTVWLVLAGCVWVGADGEGEGRCYGDDEGEEGEWAHCGVREVRLRVVCC